MADQPKPEQKPKPKAKKTFSAYKPGKMCPKCGARMGDHKDRYSCGKCNYTEFKQKK
jgi:ubiquitin-small subunit ribosomal protein S27Ae